MLTQLEAIGLIVSPLTLSERDPFGSSLLKTTLFAMMHGPFCILSVGFWLRGGRTLEGVSCLVGVFLVGDLLVGVFFVDVSLAGEFFEEILFGDFDLFLLFTLTVLSPTYCFSWGLLACR